MYTYISERKICNLMSPKGFFKRINVIKFSEMMFKTLISPKLNTGPWLCKQLKSCVSEKTKFSH